MEWAELYSGGDDFNEPGIEAGCLVGEATLNYASGRMTDAFDFDEYASSERAEKEKQKAEKIERLRFVTEFWSAEKERRRKVQQVQVATFMRAKEKREKEQLQQIKKERMHEAWRQADLHNADESLRVLKHEKLKKRLVEYLGLPENRVLEAHVIGEHVFSKRYWAKYNEAVLKAIGFVRDADSVLDEGAIKRMISRQLRRIYGRR